MNEILETTNVMEKNGWMPIINGKIRFRQNQLFFIHQLSQTIRKEKGERMGFDTPEKLYELISYASQSDSTNIREKLHKVIDSFSPELKDLFTH